VTVPVADSDLKCAVHGVEKHLVRTEQSSVLDYVPGHFQVTEIHREVRACRPCNGSVVIAPVADKVIDGGLPGPGLLAEVVVRKYGEHMPLERMSKSFARDGVHLAPSTLGDWVTAAATALEPIVKRIESLVFASFVMSADPTSVRVLDRNEPTGRRFGQMWGMIGDGELALIEYTSDQKGETIETLLAPRIGYLQMDGALGFNALFEGPAPPVRVRIGCLAHAIRKFQAAQEAGDVRAIVGLSLIGKLYDIEKRATEDGVDTDERTRRRDTAARPILEELREWLETTRPSLPPKTPLGTAVGYASNQWNSLVRYVEDGRIPIDNNHVERLHRAPGIGRRNWLFCGNDDGARRAAILYTVLANCGLHGVEPAEYLRDVLWKLATGWPASRLDELLPHRWKAARRAADPDTDPS
jgi:transposase